MHIRSKYMLTCSDACSIKVVIVQDAQYRCNRLKCPRLYCPPACKFPIRIITTPYRFISLFRDRYDPC